MIGILSALIAGAAMSIQGVFNTRISDSAGLLEANLAVQAISLICSALAVIFFGKGSISSIFDVNRLYLTGGIIGTLITVTVMLAISKLSTTYAVSVILIAQLFTAALVDAFGLFGTQQQAFSSTKFIALALMTGGILLFQS